MTRFKTCGAAVLLAISSVAWAGDVEPYPEAIVGASVSTKTRAEVVAELHEAIRVGRMYDFPNMYADTQALAEQRRQLAASAVADGPSTVAFQDDAVIVWGDPKVERVRIQAEAAEANRLGLLAFGEGDPPIATAEQERLIAAAGRRAIAHIWVVGSL